MSSEIRQLIANEQDLDKRNILKQLPPYCKEAYLFMTDHESRTRPGPPRKKKRYRALQRTKAWREARLLIRDFFINNDNKLICEECKEEIIGSFVLHHNLYPKNPFNLFNPLFCSILHNNNKCHHKGNPKDWRD